MGDCVNTLRDRLSILCFCFLYLFNYFNRIVDGSLGGIGAAASQGRTGGARQSYIYI